jgi:hypothetical protein
VSIRPHPVRRISRETVGYGQVQRRAHQGWHRAMAGLHPSSKGARVKFSGTHRTVVDGPFTAIRGTDLKFLEDDRPSIEFRSKRDADRSRQEQSERSARRMNLPSADRSLCTDHPLLRLVSPNIIEISLDSVGVEAQASKEPEIA